MELVPRASPAESDSGRQPQEVVGEKIILELPRGAKTVWALTPLGVAEGGGVAWMAKICSCSVGTTRCQELRYNRERGRPPRPILLE